MTAFSADKDIVQEILDSLLSGFAWNGSVKGSQYWVEVATNLISFGADLNPTSNPPPNVIVRSKIQFALQQLMLAFTWSDSPQGSAYWSEVHTNLHDVLLQAGNSTGSDVVDDEKDKADDAFDRAMKGI